MDKSMICTETGRENGVYYFRKHNGIKYELLEGLTIGTKETKRFASDMLFVMLSAYDDLPTIFVGWMFGACLFDTLDDPNHSNPSIDHHDYLIRELDHITDKWESENEVLVQEILVGKYEEMY